MSPIFVSFVGYIALYTEVSTRPFILASILCVYSGLEEILITFIRHEDRTDVRSIWSALQY